MIDFAKHLKGPRKEEDPSIIRGTLTARITPSIKGQEPYDRECEWEIGPYAAFDGTSTTFKITKGGPTGYESFTLRDQEQTLNHRCIHRSACRQLFLLSGCDYLDEKILQLIHRRSTLTF